MAKKLVDLEKLRWLIAGLDLGAKKRNEYIEACWLNCVGWWDARASDSKWKHQTQRSKVSEGFSFIQLTGEYKDCASHKDALKQFAANVEQLIRTEVKDCIVAVTPKRPELHPNTGDAKPTNA